MPEHLHHADDARLAPFRGVRDPEILHERGQFIAEGRLVVRRVVESGAYRVRALLVNDAALEQLGDVLPRVGDDACVFVGDTELFVKLTGYNIHRGCLALVDRPAARTLDTMLADASALVVLEAIANADNVGAVFRNAAAFRCGGVILSPGCCDPFYRKAIRTSMGAVLQLPFASASPWPDALRTIRDRGFTIAALTPRAPATDLDAFARQLPHRVAFVAGTEGAGLSAEAETLADVRVRIPISDAVDSLNVATAVAIALHALR